jgi:hypothetical protein
MDNLIENTIFINLYCDEVKYKKCDVTGNNWHYFGILIVPISIEEDLLEDLICKRFRVDKSSPIDIESKYFNKNNKIVHFSDLDADTYHIAKRWHEYILDPKSSDKIYLNILGINGSHLNRETFGERFFENVYNRFFRTAMSYPIKKFFKDKNIIIEEIFHEVGDQQNFEIFPWHAIYKINSDEERISCSKDEITFLNKSHRDDDRANFIQLIDIILGAFVNLLHCTTNDEFKVKLTDEFSPLFTRLIKKPNNQNSNYCKNYHSRMNISFFPREALDPKDEYYDFKKHLNQFYKKRELSFLKRFEERLF